MAGIIFKGVVLGNLIALNAIVYLGYRTFSGGLDLLKSEIALQMEERLKKSTTTSKRISWHARQDAQVPRKLIPKGGTVKSGLPIF